jgi:tripartite-type tricarboxylate transporter receptor subunit TctC
MLRRTTLHLHWLTGVVRYLVCLLALCEPLAAQTYPDRAIKMIAPIAPGGLTDTLARDIAAGLSKKLAQSVIVENRPGGAGTIGMMAAAQALLYRRTLQA